MQQVTKDVCLSHCLGELPRTITLSSRNTVHSDFSWACSMKKIFVKKILIIQRTHNCWRKKKKGDKTEIHSLQIYRNHSKCYNKSFFFFSLQNLCQVLPQIITHYQHNVEVKHSSASTLKKKKITDIHASKC